MGLDPLGCPNLPQNTTLQLTAVPLLYPDKCPRALPPQALGLEGSQPNSKMGLEGVWWGVIGQLNGLKCLKFIAKHV